MPTPNMLKKTCGDMHEAFLLDLLGGTQSPGSGNQWHRPMDGRQDRREQEFAFAWDGKSTLAKSHSVTLDMWNKAVEQSGGERPMLGLRWYPTERPSVTNRDGLDLVCLRADDLAALLAAARQRGVLLDGLADLLDQADDPEWAFGVHLDELGNLVRIHS